MSLVLGNTFTYFVTLVTSIILCVYMFVCVYVCTRAYMIGTLYYSREILKLFPLIFKKASYFYNETFVY